MLPRRLSNNASYAPTGALSKQISILKVSPTRNSDGTTTFFVFDTVWGFVQTLNEKYVEKAQQVVEESTHRITIRYYPGITEQNRIQVDTRVFNIEAVIDPDDRQFELQLFCWETD
jgi:SPP1 family predicted phage head-tail adaptor